MITSSEDPWGELRSWHAQEHLRGRHLGPLLDRWYHQRPEELFEAVIPYCLDKIRQRDEKSVHPLSPVPYSAWVDRLLEEAMDADRERRDEDAIRAYEKLLCFKPDCVPAHLNLYRLRHRDTPFDVLLDTHDWEAHGPYGSDSWENVKSHLIALDPRSGEHGAQRLPLSTVMRSLMVDIEHQATIYPSTLATIELLIMLMDRPENGLLESEEQKLATFLRDLLFYTLFSPYHSYDMHELSSRDEARRAEAIAQFSWPVKSMWSFVDPVVKRFSNTSALRSFVRAHYTVAEGATRAPIADLFFEKRGYCICLDDSPRTYYEYEVCKLPCLQGDAFWREERNLVYEHIAMPIFQSITAGIPVFERFCQTHEPQECARHEALLWHLGHFARERQSRIAARVPKKERYTLSM